MKNELRDSALWAVVVSFFSAVLALGGVITTAIMTRRSKDKETDVKADADIRDDRKDITDGYRLSWKDCKDELAESNLRIEEMEKSVLPLRRRLASAERRALLYEEALTANGLLCLVPVPESNTPPAP